MSRRDTAARLLATAVRLLPAPRREWGEAMLAELDSIEPRQDRRRFTAGCVGVVVTRPAVWRRAGYALLPAALVGYVVHWSAWIGWAPRRWSVVAFAAALAVVAELGLIGPLGPVALSRTVRFTRAVAYLLVGALAVEATWFLAHQTNTDLGGAPVLAVMFAGYLAGALAMTGHRSPAAPRTLLAGLAGGAAIAAAWTAVVVLDPPIPPHVALAVVLAGISMAGTGIVVNRRHGPAAAWCAATTAGTTGALLILNLVTVLSVAGPADLIPHLMPPALPLADQVNNSRIELTDRYLWLLLLGWFVAITQWVASRPALEPSDKTVISTTTPSGAPSSR
ncbi:hypothetical protein Drose_25320 [Dactylosporangium roseum]|uniref:Integral membrane protein n=1 Tax=Dactylosporangium roseum TaxID=47989 RepID=A0ABY5Z179_9ACTN|nr:hypothetical protein [Dactylosporangium roseum]UWZ34533.1 hypothetical protein Drose_25320 [Dactylosporangium roseum]